MGCLAEDALWIKKQYFDFFRGKYFQRNLFLCWIYEDVSKEELYLNLV
jgi:hypothetical protein